MFLHSTSCSSGSVPAVVVTAGGGEPGETMANQHRAGQHASAGPGGRARSGDGEAAGTGPATRAARTGAARAGAAGTGGASAPGARSTQRAGATGTAAEQPGRTVTVTIPDRAIDIAMLPVAAGRRLLAGRSGLPVYVGLGVLAVADIIELPVAAAAGVGYAALRRWGPLHPPRPEVRRSARSSPGTGEE